jgi:hypothetical protein
MLLFAVDYYYYHHDYLKSSAYISDRSYLDRRVNINYLIKRHALISTCFMYIYMYALSFSKVYRRTVRTTPIIGAVPIFTCTLE